MLRTNGPRFRTGCGDEGSDRGGPTRVFAAAGLGGPNWRTFIDNPFFATSMAKMRNYKIVNARSKSMGSAGAQILLGRVDKIDAQSSSNGWLEGIKLSWLMSDVTGTGGGQLNFGGIFYLATDDTWSDDNIIAVAAAGQMSGSVYLRARRSIRTKANPDSYNDIASGSGGPIYLWGEVSDSTLTANVTCRIVTETWGRNIIFTEV